MIATIEPPSRAGTPGRTGRAWPAAAALAVLLVAALAVRLATEQVPPLSVDRTLASFIRLGGSPPRIAWPLEGEAAVEVEGVGSFGTSGGSAPVPIASVAKVMTAYLTLRELPLAPGAGGFVLRITPAEVAEQHARAAEGQSTVAVRSGEALDERQALEAMMLPSGNNIATLLAARDAGTVTAFLQRMNAAARTLRMRSTTYTDPSGLAAGTVSTAADQLRLVRAAMAVPAFAAIVGEASAQLPVAGKVGNLNKLVGHEGFTGVKTGSDGPAGGCLVFTRQVLRDGRRLTIVGAVLGQRQGGLLEAAIASARRLGDSAGAAVGLGTALPAGSTVLRLSGVDGGHTAATTARALRQIGWAGLRVPVTITLPARGAMRSASAGERVATVELGGGASATSPALATRAIGSPSLGWRLAHVL